MNTPSRIVTMERPDGVGDTALLVRLVLKELAK